MATPIPPNEAEFTLESIVRVTSGLLTQRGAPAARTRGITTDSRAVVRGSVFVALRGATQDGHQFVDGAIEAGASVVIVEEDVPPRSDVAVLKVQDTLSAWGALATEHIRSWKSARRNARVVAITGSAGKTTTKEMCASILQCVGSTHATEGNLNNRIGVPAVAFGLRPEHQYFVVEVGMSLPGEIALLAKMVSPDIAVLTNVGLAHAGGVGGTVEDVAREKGALFEAVSESGVVVANCDDDMAWGQTQRSRAKTKKSFGRSKRATYRLVDRSRLGETASRITAERLTDSNIAETILFDLPMSGEAAALDAVAAIAAADSASESAISSALISKALGSLRPLGGRNAARRLADGTLLIDDSYNANPSSMNAALRALEETGRASGRRTVAILGEMKELGSISEREHDLLGQAVADAKTHTFIGCGGDLIARAIRVAKAGGVATYSARDVEEASEFARQWTLPGDAILVKGSNSVGTSKVVAALIDEKGTAPENEVRPDAL